MGFGIYKPGQGYWIRTLTAGAVGAIVLAAAAWAGAQAGLFTIPTPSWSMAVRQTQGEAISGQSVVLLGETLPDQTEPMRLGTALIKSVDTDAGLVIVESIELVEDALTTQTLHLAAQGVAGQGLTGQTPAYRAEVIKGTAQGIPLFEPMYLKIGVGIVVIVIGGLLIFWFVYANRKTADFLIATDGEMKKVNWSTRKEIIGSTWVVVSACFLIALLLFVIDFGFSSFFKLINVLDG